MHALTLLGEQGMIVIAMENYLTCTEIIDCDTESIVAKAQELTHGLETDREKAVALFYFVRDGIKYNPYAPGDFHDNRASVVLERGHGFCYQKAILLAALARAVGIPARLGFADIRNHLMSKEFSKKMFGSNVLVYHGWAELYIDDSWVIATPAYDLKTCKAGGFIPVEFDGVSDAKFHRSNRDGKLHIEYIKQHGHYEDLPWAEIIDASMEMMAKLGVDRDEFIARWTETRE